MNLTVPVMTGTSGRVRLVLDRRFIGCIGKCVDRYIAMEVGKRVYWRDRPMSSKLNLSEDPLTSQLTRSVTHSPSSLRPSLYLALPPLPL